MRPDPRTEAEVKELLARIVDAAGRRDAGAAIAMFADDPDVFLFGTGVDEARKGPAGIRERISSAGAVAWTAGDVVIRVVVSDRALDVPHRLTTVLERRDGKWLILQIGVGVDA